MIEAVNEKEIAQFLLGELSEEKRIRIEKRVFEDHGFYEQVLAIQEELADDYIRNNLSPTQRLQFDSHFLRSPRRRERVKFAAAFAQALGSLEPRTTSEPRESWWTTSLVFRLARNPQISLATAITVMVLVVGAVWLYVDNRRLSERAELARAEKNASVASAQARETESERERQRLEEEIARLKARGGDMEATIQQKEGELEQLKHSATRDASSVSQIATFILSPGLTRGADEPEKILISSKSRVIQFQLALEKPEDYRLYVAEIRTARGNLVLSRGLPAAQQTSFGQAVLFTVPVSQLPIGEYEITLKGASGGKLQSVAYYYFIALKR